MGDSVWRLETALNHLGEQVHAQHLEREVEVVVADWGSEPELRDVLELNPAASRLTRFLHVPRELALELQQDSPFPEVLALNAAARRAKGEYIGRIDQDTLVGARFLREFFEIRGDERRLDVPMASALLFSGRRDIPYRFAVRRPPLWAVGQFVERRGAALQVESAHAPGPFYLKGVGIWLAHRRLWHECGGYDERMIYMNNMEANMIQRLMKRYPIVDLGSIVAHDFYHLEHYNPRAPRKSSAHRKVNPLLPFSAPERVNPNGEAWGLAAYSLPAAMPSIGRSGVESSEVPSALREAQLLLLMALVSTQGFCDRIALASGVWKTRTGTAWRAVHDRPPLTWPRVLRDLWVAKRTARQARTTNGF
jgi:hypothetical protein